MRTCLPCVVTLADTAISDAVRAKQIFVVRCGCGATQQTSLRLCCCAQIGTTPFVRRTRNPRWNTVAEVLVRDVRRSQLTFYGNEASCSHRLTNALIL